VGRKSFTSRASERKSRAVVRLKEKYGTTLSMLFVGSRVRLRGQPQTSGEVVRVIPMTGRVIVRLDPPHPAWRGTLRSFRPERLEIYP
jgi:hypothetical protein